MDAAIQHGESIKSGVKVSRRKLVKWILIVAVLIVAAFFAFRYWRHSQLYVSTDNAYINANIVEVAAQVAGPIVSVHVRDNQQVKKGDLLFEVDPAAYQLALEKAEADLRLAEQSVAQESAAVSAAEALVRQREAELRNARSNNERTQRLVRQGFLSAQGSEAAATQFATAAAALQAAQANLEEARSALGKKGKESATVQSARAAVDQARLNLERTHVTAPTQGTVANFSLRPGNTVQPGAPLFVLIGNQEFWADANFKETELERIRAGETATITVDMYPHHPFQGVVESLSSGSGTAFSLLPPQNATGNWVKVTQRVPVRVRIANPSPDFPLRVGTTATVEVAISQAAGSAPSAQSASR